MSYNQGSSRYINFNSVGQLWNRNPDETYRQIRTTTIQDLSVWREITLNFTIDQPILLQYLNFKQLKSSDDGVDQILLTDQALFSSNSSGNVWNTLEYTNLNFKDCLISGSGNVIIKYPYSGRSAFVNIDNSIDWIETPHFSFVESSNTYYFNVESSTTNYDGNTIYAIINSEPEDYFANPGSEFVGNRVAKSLDYGNTWSRLTTFDTNISTSKIVCSSSGDIVYAITQNQSEIAISLDGCNTVTYNNFAPTSPVILTTTDLMCSKDGRVVVITVESIQQEQYPFNPESIVTKIIYLSRDYGTTWDTVGVNNEANILYNIQTFLYQYQNISMSNDGKKIVITAKKQILNTPYVYFISLDEGLTWQEFTSQNIIPSITNDYIQFAQLFVTPDGSEIIALLKGKWNYINPYVYGLSDKTWTFSDFYVE